MNNFATGYSGPYRYPSQPARDEEQDIDFQNHNTPNIVAGLKAAQDELSGFASTTEEEDKAEASGENPATGVTVGDALKLQIEEYVKRINNDRLRLEQAKAYLEESQKKVDERLGKVRRLEEEVEKISKNIEAISGELSSAEENNINVFEQIKRTLSQLQNTNEQRDQYPQSDI